jgi:hypothetical protein
VDESRYFILSRYNGQVVAAEAPLNISEEWPASFSVNGIEYFPLEGHDTFFFWDELRNAAGSTVGYTFLLPESPAFRNSAWVQNSGNVVLDGEEVRILLGSCDEPVWECVQGFGSDVYVNKNDQSDCIIYMLDFSENPIAFSLHSLS